MVGTLNDDFFFETCNGIRLKLRNCTENKKYFKRQFELNEKFNTSLAVAVRKHHSYGITKTITEVKKILLF